MPYLDEFTNIADFYDKPIRFTSYLYKLLEELHYSSRDDTSDCISTVPSELRDNYSEIRRLDMQFQECQKQLEELCERELKDAIQATDSVNIMQNFHFSRKVVELSDKCKEMAEKKIKLAMQTYERVDGHVRRLDKYLKKFDNELRRVAESELISSAALVHKSDVADTNKKARDIKARRKKRPIVDESVSMDLDLPVDPNEPTYCLCNRVSFGNMVACDNEHCKTEWFHFECVGITDQPKGKWYCPECAPKIKHRKRG